jgi:hypothetical protein
VALRLPSSVLRRHRTHRRLYIIEEPLHGGVPAKEASIAHRATGSRGPALRHVVVGVIGVGLIAALTTGMPPALPDIVLDAPDASSLAAASALAQPLRRIARILQSQFDLPLPVRVVTRFYASRERLTIGLVTHAGLTATTAGELTRFAAGIALPNSLLVRMPPATTAGDEWTRLLAHELTHLAQIELAGGEPPAARWLSEGVAEWVAYGVLDYLQPGALHRQQRSVARTACEASAGRLQLATLSTARGFLDLVEAEGSARIYHIAFTLTDQLVARRGFDAARRYFGAFRVFRSAEDAFRLAFGTSTAEFESAAVATLASRCTVTAT